MNQSDIIRSLANRRDITIPEAKVVMEDVLDLISLALTCGEDVNFSGFGKFEVRNRKPVIRRNPRNGVQVQVPAKVSLGFKPSPCLKSRMNG